ncbi:MAG TPA: formylglycine-generating enzyme family protein [Fimbriimonadaceae bacterium]|nr:formylglycine-generating enzyme family protein [Fimbriimonadaceae bacterium]
MQLCWCPLGRFLMGSPPGEPNRRTIEGQNEAQVEVTLTHGFWIGQNDVTQGQWKQAMGALPGDTSAGAGGDFPVYNVDYEEAQRFCRRITEAAHASGALPGNWVFDLPTEAQWEYACRAGTKTATPFGSSLSSGQANFNGGLPYNGAAKGPFLDRVSKVGSYPANAWHIYDMAGNVWQWCRDLAGETLPGGTDPLDLRSGSASHVRRGGCWDDPGWACRSACRSAFEASRRATHIGFRVVLRVVAASG